MVPSGRWKPRRGSSSSTTSADAPSACIRTGSYLAACTAPASKPSSHVVEATRMPPVWWDEQQAFGDAVARTCVRLFLTVATALSLFGPLTLQPLLAFGPSLFV